MLSQPFRPAFTTIDGPGEHIPDFLAVTHSGSWLIDVRPGDRIKAEDGVRFAAAAEVAPSCEWRYFRLHQLSGRGSLMTSSRTRESAKSRKSTIWPSRMRRIWMDVAANDRPVVVRVPFVRISTITTSASWVW